MPLCLLALIYETSVCREHMHGQVLLTTLGILSSFDVGSFSGETLTVLFYDRVDETLFVRTGHVSFDCAKNTVQTSIHILPHDLCVRPL